MFWEKDLETMPRKKLEELQLERLRWLIDHADRNVPFYHERFQKAGITAEKIKSLSDIQYLPYTTKDDLRDHYPYGLCAVPKSKIIRTHASSGTTGKPTLGLYTKNDLENWANQVARFCTAVGVTQEDIIQVSFGYGLFTGALGLHYGLEKIGCDVIPASSGNTNRQLMLIEDLGVTGLVATPSYAMYMSEVAKENGTNLDSLRIGLFGSEGCTPELAGMLAKNFGILVSDNYGMTELNGPGVSGDCIEQTGMHFAEDHFLPEIIDSDTLEVKERGEEGELVITTLTKEGMPMIRYRTKDITRLHYDACPCGRTHVRMEKVKGRSDDMVIIKGVNVFPSQIESVLVSMPEIAAHYQLIIRRDQKFRDTLEIKVELVDASYLENYKALENLQQAVRERLRDMLRLDVKISLVQPKSLERFQGKAKRIVDLRNEPMQ